MKKKVKVLQVIPRLGYGGAETGCYDLAHFLPEKDCKSYIATRHENDAIVFLFLLSFLLWMY